ncbi:MAG TPA: hypothetical protein VN368_03025 [Candidatus Methylomirabilis sp.]|nr:hypothetical protein [Candidatus Methylomirabilis sp.]
MINNQLDIKSLRSYGIHGALGLLMGIGAGFILGFILIMLISSLTADFSSVIQGITVLVAILVIYGIYGFYVGYIFGGQTKASKISITCAAAGAFGGLVTAGLLAGNFIPMSGDSVPYLVPLFITLVFTGPLLGFPKIKNIVLMTVSSASGAALGYIIFISGQYIAVYINNVLGLFAIIIAIPFSLLAIGIAGASIAIGFYFTEGTAYTSREIPGFLKRTRGAGIFLTLIVLIFSSLIFFNVAKYANTDVSIDISSGDGEITVYIPVLLENGTIMEMYRNPTILGNATTEIIDTDYGKAFKISGSGSTRINMKKTGGLLATNPEANEKFVNGFKLSTSNATNYGNGGGLIDAWVYSEEDGTRFKLSITRDNGWGKLITINTEHEVKLTRGWQEVGLNAVSMWYD